MTTKKTTTSRSDLLLDPTFKKRGRVNRRAFFMPSFQTDRGIHSAELNMEIESGMNSAVRLPNSSLPFL